MLSLICLYCSIINFVESYEARKPACSVSSDVIEVDSSSKRSQNLFSCSNTTCPVSSFCYLGSCPCHPGYSGSRCEVRSKKSTANRWYTKNCPNLDIKETNTIDINTPFNSIGGDITKLIDSEWQQSKCNPLANPSYCAYLCYSHNTYGTAVVPISLWKLAQR